MPCRAVAHKNDHIVRIRRGQMLQKDVHARCVAVGQDQKRGLSCQRLYCSIHIPVFPNMMAWNRWADAFPAPAILWLIDAAETRFILKHQSDSLAIVENFSQFCDAIVNFFEASTASWSALFGCLLLGIFFSHPCRCSTLYICPCPVSWPIFLS